MTMNSLFISAILNPPSFNEWQTMSSITDMIVVAVAFITREVPLISLTVAAFILVAFVIIDVKNILKTLRRY